MIIKKVTSHIVLLIINVLVLAIHIFLIYEFYFTKEYHDVKYRILHGNRYDYTSIKPFVPNEWLIKKVSIEFLKEEYTKKKPFLQDVTLMQRIMKSSDEIWFFKSPGYTWNSLTGCEGYTLVRDGKAIFGFITILN